MFHGQRETWPLRDEVGRAGDYRQPLNVFLRAGRRELAAEYADAGASWACLQPLVWPVRRYYAHVGKGCETLQRASPAVRRPAQQRQVARIVRHRRQVMGQTIDEPASARCLRKAAQEASVRGPAHGRYVADHPCGRQAIPHYNTSSVIRSADLRRTLRPACNACRGEGARYQ